MTKESQIVHESKDGKHWVLKEKIGYHVMRNGLSVASSLCTFAPDTDGLSLAVAYSDYKAKTA